ncbi:MAG: shikimate 5-dehydrogenase [Candidatus Saganbacteria bacterium]|uniref:Shikimate dehydrogenase (NADP(+)) n=1 Tax=Candidatus Saganbacteria bacterium TaxID=2575572 RepID=A0A833L1Y8_UNCSA|nr:MAG: shikimate 5-dehydrogenase [Candidatus Saganbacteria bacterium]
MKTVALIGYPLGHSISPAMHNAAYKHLNIDFEYVLLEVSPENLTKKIDGLRAANFAGFNVTIPHKEAILPLLDEITDLAREIGAVNAVCNQGGKLVGYNTDGPGFIESLKEDAKFNPKGKNCVILGAGGAGRAVAVMLKKNNAKKITIHDAIAEKAKSLASFVEGNISNNLQKEISTADLLVNASPIGMHPNINDCPLPDNIKLHNKIVLYDLVYNPYETKLLKLAKNFKAKAISGLGMLVRQGALAFTIFTGKPAPTNVMLKAAKEALLA